MQAETGWAIEIKRGLAPKLSKRFHQARADLKPNQTFVVSSAADRYPIGEAIEVISLAELGELINNFTAINMLS